MHHMSARGVARAVKRLNKRLPGNYSIAISEKVAEVLKDGEILTYDDDDHIGRLIKRIDSIYPSDELDIESLLNLENTDEEYDLVSL